MSNDDQILATLRNGRHVTVLSCKNYLSKYHKNRKEYFANFIYERLHQRYLKPFEYNSKRYRKYYKNGFSMMANSCLLIETYVSFTKYEYLDTNGKSRDCFKYFFSNEPKFEVFSKDDIPNDFYDNVRCGILHNAETRKGWLITRKVNEPLFNAHTKTINAFKFANNLKNVLSDYRKKLLNSDYESDLIWTCFKDKLFLLFGII